MLSDTKPKVFVMMPFAYEFQDVYDTIKAACEQVSAICERVDEQIFTGTIVERIYEAIAAADVVVSDLTNRNPNVYYETGYAHALGKPVVLLSRGSADVPFDLRQYPLVVYQSLAELRKSLEVRLRVVLDHKHTAPSRNEKLIQRYEKDLPQSRERSLLFQLRELIGGYDTPSHQFDVFISYSEVDQNLAKGISDKVSTAGIRAFFAQRDLHGGDLFTEGIRQALRNSFELWVLMTPNSLKSQWVTTEWGAGWVLGKRVVPILLRCSADELPERLRAAHLVDYHAVDKLIIELQHRLEDADAGTRP